jgi:hypothetical protein
VKRRCPRRIDASRWHARSTSAGWSSHSCMTGTGIPLASVTRAVNPLTEGSHVSYVDDLRTDYTDCISKIACISRWSIGSRITKFPELAKVTSSTNHTVHSPALRLRRVAKLVKWVPSAHVLIYILKQAYIWMIMPEEFDLLLG